ncbi:MAG TPA: M23 family metallopeptidase [Anaeromyxobacteraceae bacterium]|nr:M23 family metallopeptidase [Anaeromyxobacteraceae bacterium]
MAPARPDAPPARPKGACRAPRAALAALILAASGTGRAEDLAAAPRPASEPERLRVVSARVGRDQTPTQALSAVGFRGAELQAALDALRELLPFRRVRPGDQVRVERLADGGGLRSLSWRRGPAEEVLVRPCGAGLCAEKRAVEVTREVVRVSITVRSSVYDAIREAGEDAALAAVAADVLAWDVDFYQDVRGGDVLKLVVERVLADGRFLRYGDVLAAEYDGAAAGRKRLFRYTDPSGDTGYYDDDGESARRGFLRAPLPYVHVTSRFGSRRHPVLAYVRAHQGVDYAAPEGTPVWAVGDGVVTRSGSSGECGLSVAVKHRGGFETVYCHLSAVSVAQGSHVAQKQVLGRVGHSGLATGPHLHYAVRRGGVFVNPLQIQLPRGEAVREAWRRDFEARIAPVRERLDATPVAWAGQPPWPGPAT